MKLSLYRGRVSKIVRVFAQDPTTGTAVTGLVFNTGGLTAYYCREGDASATAITLVTATIGTWVSGGFKEVDATNMPGIYEVGLPNAVFASGESVVTYLKHTSMRPILLEFELDVINYQDAVRLGLTGLPNANAGASGGLPTVDGSNGIKLSVGTSIGQVNLISGKVPATLASTDVTGNISVDLDTIKTQTVTCAAGVTVLASVGTTSASSPQSGDSYGRLGAAGAGLTAIGDTRLANLDAAVSTRSTYAGGAVASVTGSVGSVTAGVTVSSNSDKTGFKLAADGLDLIMLETGTNLRQGVTIIYAGSAGLTGGMNVNAPVIKGGGVNTTRITATTDEYGNRLSVALNLPS